MIQWPVIEPCGCEYSGGQWFPCAAHHPEPVVPLDLTAAERWEPYELGRSTHLRLA